MATPGPTEVANAVQQLVDQVVIPNQTADQVNAGLLRSTQVRERVLDLQRLITGHPTNGLLIC